MNKNLDYPSGDALDAEKYFSLSDEEKDLELQESITRLHKLIYQVAYCDSIEAAGDERGNDGSS